MGEDLPPIRFEPLCDSHNCSGFRCTNREINKWVEKKASKEHKPGVLHVTCALPEGQQRPIGVYAVSTVAEETRNLPGHAYRTFRAGKHFPALHLVWLATDHLFEDRGLGKIMVGQVIRQFATIGAQIGIPHLILTPAEEAREKLVNFYGKLGFELYNDGESMHLSIDKAIDAISKAANRLGVQAT